MIESVSLSNECTPNRPFGYINGWKCTQNSLFGYTTCYKISKNVTRQTGRVTKSGKMYHNITSVRYYSKYGIYG